MSKHPDWCGAHPDTHFNEDFCLSCDSDSEDKCLEDHPKEVIHRRQIDFPADWFGMDSDNFNLWISRLPGETRLRLWAAYDSVDENEARELDPKALKDFITDLNKILKPL